jgi:F-type H+-transporting ATPase subunit b
MEIDWITISAQIVNFLILVWLLKHFLYQPVIRAMDRREQRIARRLIEAQEREDKAEASAQQYREKSEELEHSRGEVLANAEQEAERQKRQWLEEAREEVAGTRTDWQRQADREKEEFLAGLRRRSAQAVQAIAGRALADLADADLEQRIVHKFIEQLHALDEETRRALADTDEPVRILSAFALESATRAALTRAIHETLAEGVDVEYAESPELLCGIELTRGGRRLGWNMKAYLDDLADRAEEAFRPLEGARGDHPGKARPAQGGEG